MEVLTYYTEFTFAVLEFTSIYVLFVTSPIVMAGFVIARERGAVKRPWLFLGTVTVVAYGLVTTILLLLLIPLMLYDIFVAPQLIAASFDYPEFLLIIGKGINDFGWIILPLLLVVISLVTTIRISQRWTSICNAISS